MKQVHIDVALSYTLDLPGRLDTSFACRMIIHAIRDEWRWF